MLKTDDPTASSQCAEPPCEPPEYDYTPCPSCEGSGSVIGDAGASVGCRRCKGSGDDYKRPNPSPKPCANHRPAPSGGSDDKPVGAWLAEKAGIEVSRHDVAGAVGWTWFPEPHGPYRHIPTPPYTPEQAWTVLTWLAKAGYCVEFHTDEDANRQLPVLRNIDGDIHTIRVFGPNDLEAALAAAVQALHESEASHE